MEGDILMALEFNLLSVSSLKLIEYYGKMAGIQEKNFILCKYLL